MKSKLVFLASVVLAFFLPLSVSAQIQCSGSLTQQQFMKEIKELNAKIQKNIIEGRKLERKIKEMAGNSEAKEAEKQLGEIKAELQNQKKDFELLNSPSFPSTSLTALGAACSDRRWVEKAKEVLLKNPEKMGGDYFIWLDKGTREVKGSKERPKLEVVAK